MDYSSPETDIACPWDFPAIIMECVAISFSRGSSRSRNQTHISCTGRWILYPWATWEARRKGMGSLKIWKLRVRGIFSEKIIIRQKSLSLSWVTVTWFGHWFTLKTRESSHKAYLLLKGLETNLKKKMSVYRSTVYYIELEEKTDPNLNRSLSTLPGPPPLTDTPSTCPEKPLDLQLECGGEKTAEWMSRYPKESGQNQCLGTKSNRSSTSCILNHPSI